MDPVLVAGVTLVYFRQRLLERQQGRVAFDALLQGLEQEGLIARRGPQRLDSTHILGQVAQMSRLEKTRETVRLFLEMLERAGRPRELPDGAAWRERYLDSEVLWHKLSQEALAAKFQQTDQDMQGLLTWVADHQDLLTHAKTQLLGRVFGEQFEVTAAGPAGRKQEDSGTVQNPHDLRSDCRRNPADSPGIREAIQLRSARYRGGLACQWAA